MNHETQDFRELKFVCPECASAVLQTRNESYINVEHFYGDGHLERGIVKHGEIMDYNYGACGYMLMGEDGKRLVGKDLGEWLMTY